MNLDYRANELYEPLIMPFPYENREYLLPGMRNPFREDITYIVMSSQGGRNGQVTDTHSKPKKKKPAHGWQKAINRVGRKVTGQSQVKKPTR